LSSRAVSGDKGGVVRVGSELGAGEFESFSFMVCLDVILGRGDRVPLHLQVVDQLGATGRDAAEDDVGRQLLDRDVFVSGGPFEKVGRWLEEGSSGFLVGES
jgi:hypothetical protein